MGALANLEMTLNSEQHVLQLLPGPGLYLELLSLLCTLRLQLGQNVLLAWDLGGALAHYQTRGLDACPNQRYMT